MSQVINTVLGQAYTFSFQYRDRPDTTNPDTYGIEWSFGSIANGSVGSVGNVWQTFSTSFIGTGAAETLTFKAIGTSTSFGTSLDNVSLAAVPVPAAVWLFGSGMLGLLGLSKRKSNVTA